MFAEMRWNDGFATIVVKDNKGNVLGCYPVGPREMKQFLDCNVGIAYLGESWETCDDANLGRIVAVRYDRSLHVICSQYGWSRMCLDVLGA